MAMMTLRTRAKRTFKRTEAKKWKADVMNALQYRTLRCSFYCLDPCQVLCFLYNLDTTK